MSFWELVQPIRNVGKKYGPTMILVLVCIKYTNHDTCSCWYQVYQPWYFFLLVSSIPNLILVLIIVVSICDTCCDKEMLNVNVLSGYAGVNTWLILVLIGYRACYTIWVIVRWYQYQYQSRYKQVQVGGPASQALLEHWLNNYCTN